MEIPTRRSIGPLATLLLVVGFAPIASAIPIEISVTSGSVGIAYPAPTNFVTYGVAGTIFGDLTETALSITGGSLTLTGTGPDTLMTIQPGTLSADNTGFFWDFGQGPFDVGVPVQNPGYVLNNSGASGTLGDMFGSVTIDGSFDAEGFGLPDPGDPTMSSFFFGGGATEGTMVPEPSTAALLALGLVGLSARRRVG